MIKILLLLLLLSTQFFAQGNIKIKAKQTNNEEPLPCMIKGGVIKYINDRPHLTVKNSDGTKYIFSYNNRHKDSCAKSFTQLSNSKNKNFPLKSNRLYDIAFSLQPINKGEILLIEEHLKIKVKVKVKEKDNNTAVKALIRTDMKEDKHLYTSFGKTLEFDYYSEYITHIESFFGTTKVLDIYTSPNLSKNPILKFRLNRAFDKNRVKLVLTNNKNLKRTFLKNKLQSESIIIDTNKKMQAVFSAKSQNVAIEKMYGTIKKFKEGNITIQSPDMAASGESVPFGIISDIDAESILVLTDSTQYPAVIAIFTTPYNKTYYHLKLNLNYKEVWKYTMTVIIKDKKGNFYKVKKKADVIHYTSCS